jgi:molybdopterin-binding protein
MTQAEFEYIKRAVKAIEEGSICKREEVKVLRTVSQIAERGATELEIKIGDRADA